MSSLYSAIANLKANWHALPDFERAQAIRPLIGAKVSRRGLALRLDTSEGTIRNLLFVLEADSHDQEMFRRGEISRNELIRRVKGFQSHHETESGPELAPETELEADPDPEPEMDPDSSKIRAPADVCQEILDWLAEDSARASFAPKILEEALRRLNWAAEGGNLPRVSAPTGISTEGIIRYCRPGPQTLGPDYLDLALYFLLGGALGVLPYRRSRALPRCFEYGPPAGSRQRLEFDALIDRCRRAVLNQNYRPTQAQKGITAVFQKAQNAFSAFARTHGSSSIPNLARPAAHTSARRLRKPARSGPCVSRGNFELYDVHCFRSCR